MTNISTVSRQHKIVNLNLFNQRPWKFPLKFEKLKIENRIFEEIAVSKMYHKNFVDEEEKVQIKDSRYSTFRTEYRETIFIFFP